MGLRLLVTLASVVVIGLGACSNGDDEADPVVLGVRVTAGDPAGTATVTGRFQGTVGRTVTVELTGADGARLASRQGVVGDGGTVVFSFTDVPAGEVRVALTEASDPSEADDVDISAATIIRSDALIVAEGETITLACTPDACTPE